MTAGDEDASIEARIQRLEELPLDERAPGFEALLAELQARLESADAAD